MAEKLGDAAYPMLIDYQGKPLPEAIQVEVERRLRSDR